MSCDAILQWWSRRCRNNKNTTTNINNTYVRAGTHTTLYCQFPSVLERNTIVTVNMFVITHTAVTVSTKICSLKEY